MSRRQSSTPRPGARITFPVVAESFEAFFLENSPAFQFYASDYLSSSKVQRMTLEAEGAYIRLLAYSWQDGSIPADIAKLAPMCKCTSRKMALLWNEHLRDCFEPSADPDKLVNRRLEEVRQNLLIFRSERSQSGSRGAAEKWRRHRSANGSAMKEPIAKNGSPSPSPSPKEEGDIYIAFGEFAAVRLTEDQHAKLKARLNGKLPGYIDRLDRYSKTAPKKFNAYKSHYAVILNWADRDGIEPTRQQGDIVV